MKPYKFKNTELVICLDGRDLDWHIKDYEDLIQKYNEGAGIPALARRHNRPKVEVAIAIMDADLKGRITSKWGALGKR